MKTALQLTVFFLSLLSFFIAPIDSDVSWVPLASLGGSMLLMGFAVWWIMPVQKKDT